LRLAILWPSFLGQNRLCLPKLLLRIWISTKPLGDSISNVVENGNSGRRELNSLAILLDTKVDAGRKIDPLAQHSGENEARAVSLAVSGSVLEVSERFKRPEQMLSTFNESGKGFGVLKFIGDTVTYVEATTPRCAEYEFRTIPECEFSFYRVTLFVEKRRESLLRSLNDARTQTAKLFGIRGQAEPGDELLQSFSIDHGSGRNYNEQG
jgi:hypothetical protein